MYTSVTYDFDLEEFDLISSNARDFISQLLRLSPRNRLSAEQVGGVGHGVGHGVVILLIMCAVS